MHLEPKQMHTTWDWVLWSLAGIAAWCWRRGPAAQLHAGVGDAIPCNTWEWWPLSRVGEGLVQAQGAGR